MNITPNFRAEEFACKCCGQNSISVELIHKLQAMRDRLKQPIVILSGYRCAKHNREVGGVRESFHLTGRAADIRVPDMSIGDLHRFVVACGLFKGIGCYPMRGFVHVDTRRTAARWQG